MPEWRVRPHEFTPLVQLLGRIVGRSQGCSIAWIAGRCEGRLELHHSSQRRVACLGVAGLVLASLIALAQTGPESARIATKRFAMRVAVSGLENPWEITWGPDAKLWVTERTALRITRVDPSNGERQVAASLAGLASAPGPGGVLGMALHPQLLRNAGRDEVFVVVTYDDPSWPPDARVTDPSSPFRRLYAKVIRLRYEPSTFALVDPVTDPGRTAGRQRSPRPPTRVRARRHAAPDRRRSGQQSARQRVQSGAGPTIADAGRDRPTRLVRLRREDPAPHDRWQHSGRQPGPRRRAQPRLHVRTPQPAGADDWARWGDLHHRSRSEDRR